MVVVGDWYEAAGDALVGDLVEDVKFRPAENQFRPVVDLVPDRELEESVPVALGADVGLAASVFCTPLGTANRTLVSIQTFDSRRVMVIILETSKRYTVT